MFYPTVYSKENDQRHIVKDKNICECGFKYNGFSTFIMRDFKKIQFKHVKEITCPKCKSVLKQ
ncbi:hypothetical protein CVD25_11235 [Bacillus canaveralius]|uniref:Uncharacterized protein n=1 Tax=Bacillus canaveralius TaxID=1403243 RepID=A0A2N5GLV2_9BACI|nr:hypothetical protein CU635_09960 [Bacillus canaveralius]PLR85172.1 hypothetical protein CVD23_09455 [Bacillus sp. V33-4]PLR97190.1 hypothetical protein CVD25_11235 [Bacillus canaveralius]